MELKHKARKTKDFISSQVKFHTTRYIGHFKWARQKSEGIFSGGEEERPMMDIGCLITWPKVCMPKDLGGLGLHDLKHLGWALRLRWLSMAKTHLI